jgi:hypothetical protein
MTGLFLLRGQRLELLERLASSGFSDWLSVSMAGFPTLIALHSVGMGAVVGLTSMVCLRLYHVFDGISAQVLPKLLTVAIWGFYLNLVTGVCIFITRADEYATATIFLVKMAFVLFSTVLVFWLRRRLQPWALVTGEPPADPMANRVALLASLTWFAAVLAGRLIAYLSDLY